MSEISCRYFPACKGCDTWTTPYAKQMESKLSHLRQLLNLSDEDLTQKDFFSIQPYGLRQRFDFTIEQFEGKQQMGLYGENRKLIDVEKCLQLSPELQKAFEQFRLIPIRTKTDLIKKASIRLRVGPTGLKGCWLDLANIDIKKLLEDGDYLQQLMNAGFQVEMGQKGKSVQVFNGKYRLTDPQSDIWFQTQTFQLHSLISDFTQPSWQTADQLTAVLMGWLKEKSIQTAIEFGPGLGQFTIPLLKQNILLDAFENNSKAVEVLQKNAKYYHLDSKLKIHFGDFQNQVSEIKTSQYDLVLVNPPRSGLKKFVDVVIATQAKTCIYMSCFPESMQVDLLKLLAAGYKLIDAKIVDQFPQTHHYEACVLLEL